MIDLFVQGAIGLLAGLLGGLLGVGGSIIIIPGLIVYLSFTSVGYVGSQQHWLQAAAMICNVFIAAPAAVGHYRAGATIGRVIALLIPSALLGIVLGVAASNSRWFAGENGGYLAMILAGFLLYVALYNTVRIFGGSSSKASFDEIGRLPHWKVIAVGVPMGLMAGLLGIGGGALCVPLQQIILRIPLRRAIANSAATIVSVAALGALYKNLTLPQHGVEISASLRLAATLIPTAILGSYLGSRLTHILPRRILRIVFVVFMAAVAGVTFNRAYKAMARGSKSSRLDKQAAAARDFDESAPRNAQRRPAR